MDRRFDLSTIFLMWIQNNCKLVSLFDVIRELFKCTFSDELYNEHIHCIYVIA